MVVAENDQTLDMARAAVIVAGVRTGGTFLAHCLSNHPQMFWDRGEPLHHGSVWCREILRFAQNDRRRLLRALWNQTGYHVSGCKLTHVQAFHREIWPLLVKTQPLTIWLRRGNVLRQAVSVAINQRARRGQVRAPQHAFEETGTAAIEIEPGLFLRYARGLAERDRMTEGRLAELGQVLRVTYEEITGLQAGEYAARGLGEAAAARICGFLGVREELMTAELVRVNPEPLSALIRNWPAVRAAVARSEFAELLEAEGC